MSTTLILAIFTITLALIFYTVGVWSEHRSKSLKPTHLLCFWLGLCMDSTGTMLMGRLAQQGAGLTLHGVTGALAILLMMIHAVWATVVLLRKNEAAAHSFHKFSIAVWAIWLIPYILGMIIGMR